MKKITLLFAMFIVTTSAFSQAAGSLRGGASLISGSTFFGPGASFQYGLNPNIVIGLNFDYHVGSASSSLMNIEPRFDYYLNSAFNGIHLGTNIGMNMTSQTIPGITIGTTTFGGGTVSSSEIGAGALAGYTHPLSDKMFLDVSCGGGYLMTSKVVAIKPTLSVGMKF